MSTSYPTVQSYAPDSVQHRVKIADALNRVISAGKINCTLSFSLTPSDGSSVVTETTIVDQRIHAGSFIQFMPKTANAAAEMTSLYVTERITGQATVNHSNSTATDRDYEVLIIG